MLKVRGERLKAGSFYRFALNYFYVVAQRAGVSIVVIVALAGLVVLGAGALRYILLKKTEKHTICSMRKTIFNKSVLYTIHFLHKSVVYIKHFL